MDRDTSLKVLVGLRTVVGLSSWLAPRRAGQLFGLDPRRNPQAAYLGRLFGARDVALAYGTFAEQAEGGSRWLATGLACDLADAAAALAGGRGGYLSPVTTVLAGGVALGAAGLGAVALREDGSPPAVSG